MKKKNTFMRLAMALVLLVLVTTSAVGGTFAKYTTKRSSDDTARVAKWGFEPSTMNITGLFTDVYGTTVDSENGDDVIAPGTFNQASFKFEYKEGTANAPEVAYRFTVDTTGSACATAIKENENIVWYLDGVEQENWDALLVAIQKLSGEDDGSADYQPGQLPAAFGVSDNTHTIKWEWKFNTSDAADVDDTKMGNADTLASVVVKITITATQLD